MMDDGFNDDMPYESCNDYRIVRRFLWWPTTLYDIEWEPKTKWLVPANIVQIKMAGKWEDYRWLAPYENK